jgi:hypothetical protein
MTHVMRQHAHAARWGKAWHEPHLRILVLVQVADGDIGALARKGQRHRAPDARVCARDECHLCAAKALWAQWQYPAAGSANGEPAHAATVYGWIHQSCAEWDAAHISQCLTLPVSLPLPLYVSYP